MYRFILCIAALSITAVAAVPAAADDRDTCGDWMNGAEAVAACDRLIKRNPRDADAYFKRGTYYAVGEDGVAGNDYDRAIADFTLAIRLNPNKFEYYAARGDAYATKGDPDRAVADYGTVLRLKPDDALTYTKRGDVYADKMDYDRAIADYDQAIKLDPAESSYIGRGDIYNRKGDYARAIADYDAAIASGNGDDPDHTVARQHRDEAEAAQAARGSRPAR
jgi:tetratricopeptide (TPR) repeat protein